MATRWGIVTAGTICGDFVPAVQLLPTSDHQVGAVAARTVEKAKEFADRFSIPKAYESYEELAKDKDIDVVYIGSINPCHTPLMKTMLEAGKAVLCEKPLCMNTREINEVLTLAKEKKLFLMEGFWSRFFPAYDKLRTELAAGSIGEPRVLNVIFGAPILPDDRAGRVELGRGAQMDVGCYTIQMADLVFGGKPEKISATANLQPTGVDETCVVTLHYSGGRIAVLTFSVAIMLCNKAVIQGTNGIIEIPNMWCPTDISVKGETSSYTLPKHSNSFHFLNSEGFSYEAQHVREQLLKGALESPLMTHESSRNVGYIMEEVRRQIGVAYEADKQ